MNIDLQPLGTHPVSPPATKLAAQAFVESTPPKTTAATPQRHDAQSRANIQEAVDRLNHQMQETGRNLNFSVDRASDRVVITVKNADTGEVVRQIPDESLLRVSHNIEDIKGLLHNATT